MVFPEVLGTANKRAAASQDDAIVVFLLTTSIGASFYRLILSKHDEIKPARCLKETTENIKIWFVATRGCYFNMETEQARIH